MLSKISELGINVGLYRDDGLAVTEKTPRETEQIKKKMCAIFKENKLKITIEANLKVINFLDIRFNLQRATYEPYAKPNNVPLYVHKDSNHPPSIIKNIPESINTRLVRSSSDKTVFDKSVQEYQKALSTSGYQYPLHYTIKEEKSNISQRKRRSRKISWYNPPYSNNVATNVGKAFFKALDESIPPGHKLYPILNRNTVKISYSCMPNIEQKIRTHNKILLEQRQGKEEKTCNCRTTSKCPLNGKCLTSSLIYQATVVREDNKKEETYIGLTENTFKTRYTSHAESFRRKEKRNSTTLSQYIWTLKEKTIPYIVKWKIIERGKAYTPSGKHCNLCNKEKFYILCKPQMATLNNRKEWTSKCRHRLKYLLTNVN